MSGDCCEACKRDLPCGTPIENEVVSACPLGGCGIKMIRPRVFGSRGAVAPVMNDPFRPDVRPTIPSQSMRSPMLGSTSARPAATSIEAGYAAQVPLQRQGPTGMTVGGNGGQIYGLPTYGIPPVIPSNMVVRNAAGPMVIPVQTDYRTPGFFAPVNRGNPRNANHEKIATERDFVAQRGYLAIYGVPPRSVVYIDGSRFGSAAGMNVQTSIPGELMVFENVPSGHHSVRIVTPRGAEETHDVTVRLDPNGQFGGGRIPEAVLWLTSEASQRESEDPYRPRIVKSSSGVLRPSGTPIPVPQGFIDEQRQFGFGPAEATREWNNYDEAQQRGWLDDYRSRNPEISSRKPAWYLGTQDAWDGLGPAERQRLTEVQQSAQTAQQTAQLVETIVGATTGTIKQVIDAYLGYNANENALRLSLAREETSRQLNSANAASEQSPAAQQRRADLQRALDALNEASRQNAAIMAGNQASKMSPATVALIATGGVLVLGTIVFLATRAMPAPRANPSRSSRKSKPTLQKMGRKLERKISRVFG